MIVADTPRRKVGVSPGTTTFTLNGTTYVDCPADAARIDVLKIPGDPGYRAPSKPATVATKALRRVQRAFSPYGTFESLSGLGLVLAPEGDISPAPYSEVGAVMQNWRTRCGPNDPQFNTRGEAGHYYDTPLGGVGPSDLQLSRIYGYTPVVNSWVPFKRMTWTIAPWVPPTGDAGWGYPTIGPALRGLAGATNVGWGWSKLRRALGLRDAGDIATEAMEASAEVGPIPGTTLDPAQQAVLELKRHQDRVFLLSTISTAAIATTTAIGLIKFMRDEKRAKRAGGNSRATEQGTAALPVAGARSRRRWR